MLLGKYVKLNFVSDDFLTKGKVNKITINYKDLNENLVKPIVKHLPFKEEN